MKNRSTQFMNLKGFTLTELMVVVAIVAILAAMAIPSFNDMIAKNRVKSAAEDIYGLVLQAKAEAPVRDLNISVNTNTANPWCVGFSTTADCDCTNTTSCVIPVAGTNVLQRITSADHSTISLAETFAATGTTFNRVRGSATAAGTITAASGNWALRITISTEGQIRLCNPNNNSISGYEAC